MHAKLLLLIVNLLDREERDRESHKQQVHMVQKQKNHKNKDGL